MSRPHQPGVRLEHSDSGDRRPSDTSESDVPVELESQESDASSRPAFKDQQRTLSSVSSASSLSSDEYMGAYQLRQHVLTLETIRDSEARRVSAIMKITAFLGVVVTLVLVGLKRSAGEQRFVLNRSYHATNVGIGLCLLSILLGYGSFWTWRLITCVRTTHTWSLRRLRAVQSNGLRAVLMLIALISYVLANARVLADPTETCNNGVPYHMGFVRWSVWNAMLLLMLIDVHGLVLLHKPGKRKDSMVRDEPWWYHWPKYLLWAANQAILIWIQILILRKEALVVTLNDGSCQWGDSLTCDASDGLLAATGLIIAGFVVYWILYVTCVVISWNQLHKRLYQDYRIGHMLLRLQDSGVQIRLQSAGFTIFVASAVLLWLIGESMCVNLTLSWFGMIPLLIVMTMLSFVGLYLTTPRPPDRPEAQPVTLLQQFAWTERQKARRIERRNAERACPALQQEPMFCLETAIKMFYWSAMIYDYTEAQGHQFSSLPSAIREILGEVERAMAFYDLVQRRMFYERELETKVIVGWNADTIVICIRGSAARANFVADAKFLQAAHPPQRTYEGATPRVHRGFLATWQAGRINERVVEHVEALLASAEDRSRVRVLLTGHSLGGAVASLAAFDIALRCGLDASQLSCYTFGCPRVGNHAFAQEYMATVPDTWHIINDQDIVTRGMKLFGLYKRAGHRVIVNSHGDLIVRPSLLELSLLQNPLKGSVGHHMLNTYQAALQAIISSQLDKSKRHQEGLQGVLELLKDAPIVRTVLKAHTDSLGVSLADHLRSAASLSLSHRLNASFTLSPRDSLLRAADLADEEAAEEYVPVAYGDGGELGATPAAAADGPEVFPDGTTAAQLMESRMHEADNMAGLTHHVWRRVERACCALQRRWRRRGGRGGGAASPASVRVDSAGENTQDGEAVRGRAPSRPVQHSCYRIPEDADSGGGGGGGRGRKCRWRCPLSCKKEELPEGAALEGSLLEIGAAPDMKGCKLIRRYGGWQCSLDRDGDSDAVQPRRAYVQPHVGSDSARAAAPAANGAADQAPASGAQPQRASGNRFITAEPDTCPVHSQVVYLPEDGHGSPSSGSAGDEGSGCDAAAPAPEQTSVHGNALFDSDGAPLHGGPVRPQPSAAFPASYAPDVPGGVGSDAEAGDWDVQRESCLEPHRTACGGADAPATAAKGHATASSEVCCGSGDLRGAGTAASSSREVAGADGGPADLRSRDVSGEDLSPPRGKARVHFADETSDREPER